MNVQNLVRENIKRLKPYSSARHEFTGAAEVFLDANENPYENGLNRYPDPLQWEVKKVLSLIKGVPPENIFLGNGSDEVIDLLIRIFCEPRVDHIITLPPTYGMYQVSAAIADVEIREVPLTREYQPDVEAVLAAADAHSKILFLCSPNNPTGNDFEPERLRRLLAGFPGIVAVDEAYIDFSSSPGCRHWWSEFPNLVVMQTFSKAWGLAAIRLGMAFASQEIIELLNKVKPPYNINQLTQRAALKALADREDTQEKIRRILRGRERLSGSLARFPFVEKVYPSQANFILIKVTDPNDLYDHLVRKGIIVRNRSTVLLCEGSLRITVGTPEENIRLLQALEEYK